MPKKAYVERKQRKSQMISIRIFLNSLFFNLIKTLFMKLLEYHLIISGFLKHLIPLKMF